MTLYTVSRFEYDKENFQGIEVPNLPWSLADALIAKWNSETHRSGFSTEIRPSKPTDKFRFKVKPVPEEVVSG